MKRFIRTIENYIIDLQTVIDRLNQSTNKKITLSDIKLDYRIYGDSTYLVLIHKKTILPLAVSDKNSPIIRANTIKGLITIGDLVRVDYYIEYVCREYEPYHINRIEQIEYIDEENNLCSGDELDAISEYDITELYTKQGRNYILVAEKVNGEWRVI